MQRGASTRASLGREGTINPTRDTFSRYRHHMNNEPRQRALDSLRVLATPPHRMLDQIVQVASIVCGTPIALVSLIDQERLLFLARAGLDVREVPSSHSLCDHAILTPFEVLEVPDASLDPRFANSPLVTGPPGIRFYAGVPLITDNVPIGTLCAIDDKPRERLSASQLVALESLAQMTIHLFESQRHEWQLEEELAAARA